MQYRVPGQDEARAAFGKKGARLAGNGRAPSFSLGWLPTTRHLALPVVFFVVKAAKPLGRAVLAAATDQVAVVDGVTLPSGRLTVAGARPVATTVWVDAAGFARAVDTQK